MRVLGGTYISENLGLLYSASVLAMPVLVLVGPVPLAPVVIAVGLHLTVC